jgi:5-methylcytosine-specific restriction endonuclease McrA
MGKNRKCDDCGKTLPLIKEFWSANGGSLGGFRNPCKECRNKARRKKRLDDPEKYRKKEKLWRENNPDKVKESKKRDYEKHSDAYKFRTKRWRTNNLERDAKGKHERYIRLKDEIKEYNHNYYLENSDRIKDNVKIWINENPEKFKATQARRRDLKNNIDTDISEEDIKIIFDAFKNQCFKCHSKERLSIDHHYPLSKGHGLTITNAVILCKSCNSSKHDFMPVEFYSKKELIKVERIFKKIRKMICV